MIAILQARTGSTRFPKKILKKIQNLTILEHIINRLNYSKKIKKIIVATTTNISDDIVENLCIKNNTLCFRGAENNVLNRYIECAKFFKANNIIRLTADDPFVDPYLIDEMANKFTKGKFDFISNTPNKTFPLGLDVTIVKYKIMSKIPNLTNKKKHFEHVVNYLFENKQKYKYLYYDRPFDKYSQMRWTIDYKSDLQFVRKIYKNIYKKNKIFTFKDIINYLNKEK